MLQAFGIDIWTIEGAPIRMLTIPFETRMTVVRLKSGGLWLHSPVAPNEAMFEAVAALGEPIHLAAPSRFHTLYVQAWKDRFPKLTVWGTRGLWERKPELPIDFDLCGAEKEPWLDEIDQVLFEGERFICETVFCHKPSRTAIFTDIVQNHDPEKDGWFWRTLKSWNGIVAPEGGNPKDWKFTIRDKQAAARSYQTIKGWDFDKVILCHGICIENGGKAFIEKAFHWLED